MRVLNIKVPPELAARWRSWLAPARQPFFLTAGEAGSCGLEVVPRAEVVLTPEERDTFAVWGIAPEADRVAWLTLDDFGALPPAVQQRLLRLQARHGRGNLPRSVARGIAPKVSVARGPADRCRAGTGGG